MKYYKIFDHPGNTLKTDPNCPDQSVSEFKTSGTKHNLTPFCSYEKNHDVLQNIWPSMNV